MHCCMCFTPECRLTRIYNQGNEAFSKSQSRERCASRSRRIREIRQRTLQLRQGNNPCCVQTDAVILDYQGAIRTGIEPALSEYKSAVYQNEPLIAVDTFIYFFKAPFYGGIRTHDTRILEQVNPQLYKWLRTVNSCPLLYQT